MIFHDCMPVLLSTDCLSVRCPLAVYPAVNWLSVHSLSTACCLSCCQLAVCPFAVHCLSVYTLSTGCLSIRCPLAVCLYAVRWLSVLLWCYPLAVCPAVHWLSVRALSRSHINQTAACYCTYLYIAATYKHILIGNYEIITFQSRIMQRMTLHLIIYYDNIIE